jgi:hypothetical protein
MSAITFDKLAGINDALKDTVATKGDLGAVRVDLERMRLDLESKIREQELRLVVKFGGMLFVAVGVILTTIRFTLMK